ncbi:hypothetical protein [Actinomadura hibisca]|uniref:hypothetical protein n=1 Tax=Actinomadura hibisca TaxID=68565 RepID=UPI00082B08B8|nr:hypothetical protein [Actinomadura hibisca]
MLAELAAVTAVAAVAAVTSPVPVAAAPGPALADTEVRGSAHRDRQVVANGEGASLGGLRTMELAACAKTGKRVRPQVYTVAVDSANGRGRVGASGKWRDLSKRQGPTTRARVIAGIGLLLAVGAGVGLYVGHRREGRGR